MKKGIIIEYTLVDAFDGSDIHARDSLEPNTVVEILGHTTLYGIDYVKIKYGNGKTGFVDAKCIAITH